MDSKQTNSNHQKFRGIIAENSHGHTALNENRNPHFWWAPNAATDSDSPRQRNPEPPNKWRPEPIRKN